MYGNWAVGFVSLSSCTLAEDFLVQLLYMTNNHTICFAVGSIVCDCWSWLCWSWLLSNEAGYQEP